MVETVMGEERNHEEALCDVYNEKAEEEAVTCEQRQLLRTMPCRRRKLVCWLLIQARTVSPAGDLREEEPTILRYYYTCSSFFL